MSDTEHWRGFDREQIQEVLEKGAYDRRARRTRMALHESLMRLTVERGYDELTVADIATHADVGRSTFYAHFTDKDDLLRSSLGMLRSALGEAQAARTQESEQNGFGFSRFLTEHLAEQQILYRALMGGRSGPILMEHVHHAIADLLRQELAPNSRGHAAFDIELLVQFLVGAYLSVLTWWLESGAIEPPERVHQRFQYLAQRVSESKAQDKGAADIAR